MSSILIGFEDMQYIVKNSHQFLIISTLKEHEQSCLISGTMSIPDEIATLNDIISNKSQGLWAFFSKNPNILPIVVYGRNALDTSVNAKIKSLLSYNFPQIYVYIGGLFEWLLLQDVYSRENFPTTAECIDVLKYKSKSIFKPMLMITN